jgi:hypothetical protein
MSQSNVLSLVTVVANLMLGIPLSPNLLVLGFFLPHSRSARGWGPEGPAVCTAQSARARALAAAGAHACGHRRSPAPRQASTPPYPRPDPHPRARARPAPRARASESEADEIGLHILARACYDPEANVRMLQRLASHERAATKGATGELAMLRTHPLTKDRVERVRAALPGAYKVFRTHCSAVEEVWTDFARAFR